MFSIFRFRQGCLYFHSYSNVWVSLVLLKGLILSALEGAIITRQRGRQCSKEISQHNFPPPSPNVSLFRMTQINFKPSCPLHFHSEELREGEKKTKTKHDRPWEGIIVIIVEEILLTCTPGYTEVSPWGLNTVIQWCWDSGEGSRADFSSSNSSPGQRLCGGVALMCSIWLALRGRSKSWLFRRSPNGQNCLRNAAFFGLVIFFQIWRKSVLHVAPRDMG